ncbi:MAG: c-type cytochrome [Planctomycetes bacterium]|nr:c-type cytochrome [Planctomycetota bacterium]
MQRLLSLLVLAILAAAAGAQAPGPLRVFLRGGPKTHGPGQHDHPRFVAEWKDLLSARGCAVEGELRFPSADELARTDVLVCYAAENGTVSAAERTVLDAYLARGGGIVAIHDAVCGNDPHWFKQIIGGAWEHGHSKWHEGIVDLYVTDDAHPITRGAENWRFDDEIYTALHVVPEARVLLRGFHSVFDMSPQMWVLEQPHTSSDGALASAPYRAFVSIQGHNHSSFAHPAWRTLLLRGIAWAGGRDADLLLAPGEAEALRYPPGGPLAPEKAAAALELHPDFELSLVAAEPILAKPISIDWDARGRPWVALTTSYPDKQQFTGVPPTDEIAILVDRDGDGRCDERKTFFRGLDLVTSLVLHEQGVIVTAAPEILYLADTNGDDVADERRVVFSGFGYGDTHATISNLRWGPDGWIYGTQGYSGNASNHVTNAAGRDFGKIGNGLFRFRADGGAIEIVSSYGSNTWGCDFTTDGELLFTMANGAHLRHVVLPEQVLARARVGGVESWTDIADHTHVEPAVVRTEPAYAQIDFVGAFTAAAGSCMYTGGAWPDEWNAAHFVCEPTVNLVHCDVLEEKGVTYVARKQGPGEFLRSKDLWFRPVHARVGPDGALYVLDFYNQAVVHNDTRGPKHGPTNAALRPDRDRTHGRIWRIQHKQAKAIASPWPRDVRPKDLADAAILSGLESHNQWARTTAQRLLVERGASWEPIAMLASAGSTWQTKLAALRTLRELTDLYSRQDRADGREAGWAFDASLSAALASPETALRRAAWQIFATVAPQTTGVSLTDAFAGFAPGVDTRVRLSALLGSMALTRADELHGAAQLALLRVWPSLEDDWSRSAALGAALDHAGYMLQYSLREPLNSSTRSFLQPFGEALARRDGAAGVAQALAEMAEHGQFPIELIDGCLRGLREKRGTEIDARARGALVRLLEQDDLALVRGGLALCGRLLQPGELAAEIRLAAGRQLELIEDADAPVDGRRAAFLALLALDAHRAQALGACDDLLAAGAGEPNQLAVLDAIGALDDAAAGETLALHFGRLSGGPRERAFELLARRPAWANALLDRVEQGGLTPAVLGPQKMHRLRTHADAAVGARATELFAKLGSATNGKVDELVAKLLPEVDQPGDAANGKLVFAQNCAACHVAFGAGGKVGPDLSGMGAHGAKDLLPVILDPSRNVEAAFAEWVAVLKDGRSFGGVLARDAADSVLLRNSTGDVEIARVDLAELRNSGRSPMPGGFESLGAAGLRDLIAYLEGPNRGWRVLDLRNVATRNSLNGLYDRRHANEILKPKAFGVQPVHGVPFELLDPARAQSGNNVIVLKGGTAGDWDCKVHAPRRVELAVGAIVERVHVLGGIAAWGYPFHKQQDPILRWTWKYADGEREEVVLRNGVEFGDWIARHDVPGSEYVDGVLAEDSWGQLRYHVLVPGQRKAVAAIELESYDTLYAPTIVALTAELPGAVKLAQPARQPDLPEGELDALVFGGGSSHDFARWFRDADIAALTSAGLRAGYTERLDELSEGLARAKVLVLCNNQPIGEADLRARIFAHVEQGGGLLLLHAATWHNWPDWPEYNRELVGGGARSHESYGDFDVVRSAAEHPILEGVAGRFRIRDELYRFEREPNAQCEALATGYSATSGASYPVLWSSVRGRGRIVGFTLGHDGAARDVPAFGKLYANALRWLAPRQDRK